jgi:hypothetical protein
MANEKLIFPIEKRYNQKNIGGQIQFVIDNTFKGESLPISQILTIVCKNVLNGDCNFYQIEYGSKRKPIKIIVDKTQYEALMVLANG